MTPSTTAQLLLAARRGHTQLNGRDVLPASVADAYQVQDLTAAELGPIGGWKVGFGSQKRSATSEAGSNVPFGSNAVPTLYRY